MTGVPIAPTIERTYSGPGEAVTPALPDHLTRLQIPRPDIEKYLMIPYQERRGTLKYPAIRPAPAPDKPAVSVANVVRPGTGDTCANCGKVVFKIDFN